jgi:hypothetical protein
MPIEHQTFSILRAGNNRTPNPSSQQITSTTRGKSLVETKKDSFKATQTSPSIESEKTSNTTPWILASLAGLAVLGTTLLIGLPLLAKKSIQMVTEELHPQRLLSAGTDIIEAKIKPATTNLIDRVPLLQIDHQTSPLPTEPFERAREQLARRYEGILALPSEQKISKNREITPEDVIKIRQTEKDSAYGLYRQFIRQVYYELRYHPYSENATKGFDANIEVISLAHKDALGLNPISAIGVDFNDGWHRRYFQNNPRFCQNIKSDNDRFSVNAVGCQGLMDALDAVFMENQVLGEYKVPNTVSKWHR